MRAKTTRNTFALKFNDSSKRTNAAITAAATATVIVIADEIAYSSCIVYCLG